MVFNDVACDSNGLNGGNHLVREKAHFGARRRQGGESRARVEVGHGKLGLVSSVQDQFDRLVFLLDAENFFRLFTFSLDENGQLNYNIDVTEPKAWII